jgi:hypothetical protein
MGGRSSGDADTGATHDLPIERRDGALQHLAMSWSRGPRKLVLRARACQLERAAALLQHERLRTSQAVLLRPPGVLLLPFDCLRLPATRHISTISGDGGNVGNFGNPGNFGIHASAILAAFLLLISDVGGI